MFLQVRCLTFRSKDERHAEAVGRGLGKVDADEHRADQPWRVGDGDGIDVLPGQVRLVKRRIRQGVDGLDVLARGKLGHDAAVEPVQSDLERDAVGRDGSSVLHDGDGSLVRNGGIGPRGRRPYCRRDRQLRLGDLRRPVAHPARLDAAALNPPPTARRERKWHCRRACWTSSLHATTRNR